MEHTLPTPRSVTSFTPPSLEKAVAGLGVTLMESLTLLEVVEERTCRVCWGDEEDGPLVQPCACRGSIKWVHGHCLEKVRRTSPKRDAAYRCGQCRDRYRDALS